MAAGGPPLMDREGPCKRKNQGNWGRYPKEVYCTTTGRDARYLPFSSFFALFLGLHLQHLEVSKLGVELKLKFPVNTTATATPDLSHICDLCQSYGNTRSLSHWARPGIELTFSRTLCWVLNPLSHNGNSWDTRYLEYTNEWKNEWVNQETLLVWNSLINLDWCVQSNLFRMYLVLVCA